MGQTQSFHEILAAKLKEKSNNHSATKTNFTPITPSPWENHWWSPALKKPITKDSPQAFAHYNKWLSRYPLPHITAPKVHYKKKHEPYLNLDSSSAQVQLAFATFCSLGVQWSEEKRIIKASELKKAYRYLVKQYHPDLSPTAKLEAFHLLQEAHRALEQALTADCDT